MKTTLEFDMNFILKQISALINNGLQDIDQKSHLRCLPVFPNIKGVIDLQVASVVIINKLERRKGKKKLADDQT